MTASTIGVAVGVGIVIFLGILALTYWLDKTWRQ